MESNKLLIGVRFQSQNPHVDEHIELIIVRDATLGQLLDGICYGLMKKAGQKEYADCFQVFRNCIEFKTENGYYPKITLTSYDGSKKVDLDQKNRVVFRTSDWNRRLCDIGFVSSTAIVFDATCDYKAYALDAGSVIAPFNPNSSQTTVQFPEYNISTRQLYQFDTTPIKIIAPNEPPKPSDRGLFMTIFPAMLSMGMMLLMRSLFMQGSNMGMIALTAGMGVVSLVTALINHFHQKKKYKKDLADWKTQYEDYINELIIEIKSRKKEDAARLQQLYPDAGALIQLIPEFNGEIYGRSSTEDDFLSVRLGLSNSVENLFAIEGNSKDSVFSSARFTWEMDAYHNERIRLHLFGDPDYIPSASKQAYLSNLPAVVSEKYRTMHDAPLLFSIKQCGSLGIVGPKAHMHSLVHRMILDLCFHQSPEELQFVMLFPDMKDNLKGMDKWCANYNFIPHFRELFSDRSQFVFGTESANAVFGAMLNILNQRAQLGDREEAAKKPHIVVVVYEEYGMKEHAIAEYLPKAPKAGEAYVNKCGITFIFLKHYKEHLPHYCTSIIQVQEENGHTLGVLSDYEDGNHAQSFKCGLWRDEELQVCYGSLKFLAALRYSRISQNGKVPSSVGLFEMFHIKDNKIDVASFWDRTTKTHRKVTESLAVPIGKSEISDVYLDLHENADGPHMLVAGTTGSGKSETIISYLLGLCLYFTPLEVNLMLVDMKGGGFIKRIGDLPHVVGKVTDVDGDENGTGAEYMLRRFLDALAAEIKRRKILFNQMGVDSIDKYISVCLDIEAHIKKKFGNSSEEEKNEIRRMAKEDKLSHLILVVDEFTELKRFSTNSDIDFIAEITTIARVGRSLGLHIILISQNIEGAITDDIRINSKSRLCLKVATRQASTEMIGNDLAAAPTMPGHGRAYLLVGTGSKFEYFQSAYSGVTTMEDVSAPLEIIQAEKTGTYTSFYRSEKDNVIMRKKKKEAEDKGLLETQLEAFVKAIKRQFDAERAEARAKGEFFAEPHIVFQPPLPKRIVMDEQGNIVALSEKEKKSVNGGAA